LNRFSFQEYFQCGLEIQTICAIDFTQDSVPFHKPVNGVSLIEQILDKVLLVLEPLDKDRAYSLYGFGGKPADGSPQKPYFPLNGSFESPECIGAHEAINCYHKNLPNYTHGSMTDIKGPKYKKNDFYPVIQMVLDQVVEGRQSGWLTRKYFLIVVLITSDDITEIETIKRIVLATEEPISIVLIGIGPSSKFPKLTPLDADDNPLEIKNPPTKAKRDIVQFVNIDPEKLKNSVVSRDYLEREILAEVPAQVCSFMSMNFISPRNL
jgi:hypothetical protein